MRTRKVKERSFLPFRKTEREEEVRQDGKGRRTNIRRKEGWGGNAKGKELNGIVPECRTFALWRVLAAISEYVDLIDGSVRLKQLLQLLLRPGARDLAHKHLDGIRIRLVRMLQRPVHLPGRAVTVDETGDGKNYTRQV